MTVGPTPEYLLLCMFVRYDDRDVYRVSALLAALIVGIKWNSS